MEPYEKELMDNSPLIGFHVRSSSSKSKLHKSKKTFAFFLHRGSLWYWKQDQDTTAPVKMADTNSSSLHRFDDDNIVFRNDDGNLFKLSHINIEFSDFSEDIIYQEDQTL